MHFPSYINEDQHGFEIAHLIEQPNVRRSITNVLGTRATDMVTINGHNCSLALGRARHRPPQQRRAARLARKQVRL